MSSSSTLLIPKRRREHGFVKGSFLLVCIVLMVVILTMGWAINIRQLTYTAQNFREADRVRLSNASRDHQEALVSASQTYLKKLVAAIQELWNHRVETGQPPPTLAEAQAFLNDFFPRYVPFEMRGATIVAGMSPELKYYPERMAGTALMRLDLDGIVPRSARGLPGNGVVLLLTVTIPYRLELTETALPPETEEIRQFGNYWTLVTARSGTGSPGNGTGGGKDSPSRASKEPPKPGTLDASPYFALPSYEATVEYKLDVAFSPPVRTNTTWTLPLNLPPQPCFWYPVQNGVDEKGDKIYTLNSSCGGTIMGTFSGPDALNNANTAAGLIGGGNGNSDYTDFINQVTKEGVFSGPIPGAGGGLTAALPRPGPNQWRPIDGDATGGTTIVLSDSLRVPSDSNIRSIRLRFSDAMPLLPGRFSYQN